MWRNGATCCLNENAPTLAATIAPSYQEYDLCNWRIPTVAEAKALKTAYTPAQAPDQSLDHSLGQVLGVQDFESINALLRNLEASELHLSEGSTNARYLCEEAQKTFSFAPQNSLVKSSLVFVEVLITQRRISPAHYYHLQ